MRRQHDNKGLRIFLTALSICVGLTVFWGCSEREGPGPPSVPTGVLLAGGQGSQQITFLNEVTYREIWVKGGQKTVQLRLHGHQLTIPKKALPENQIVVVRIELPLPGVVMLSLKPHGLTFAHGHPATLSFSYEDADLGDIRPRDLAIYREIGSGEGWECLGGKVNPGEKTVTVDLEHFSRYALASR